MGVTFQTNNRKLQSKYEAALAGLKRNTIRLYGYDEPVLIEGGHYQGIWLECGPMESAIYGLYAPEVALASHRIFFHHQRDDGYIPLRVTKTMANYSQVQTVVPIASTALEVYKLTGDEVFLTEAYEASLRYDEWLVKYRNTRGTGLVEAFCEWDTGHDNSPRFKGVPRKCPDNDARLCPEEGDVPYLAPDLSATLYGGRLSLAEMAELQGMPSEAEEWRVKAENVRRAILAYCFDPEDLCFYDLDKHDRFRRIKGDVVTRVLCEQVVDQELFEEIFKRHILNPEAFWTPYPLPSIAVNDPAFDHELPTNSWGGAAQCLTALRAPRWFEPYGKSAELTHMMKRWMQALWDSPGFQQQMNPWTGEFMATDDYSPAMCVLIDFLPRLYGVRKEGGRLEWNCRLPEDASFSVYRLDTPGGEAELRYQDGMAELKLEGTSLMKVSGSCRVVTNLDGELLELLGTESSPVQIEIRELERELRSWTVQPNERILTE